MNGFEFKKKHALNFLCVLCVLCGSISSSAQTTRPTTQPSFIVGVWRQPSSTLAMWKARGINTVVGTVLDRAGMVDRDYVIAAHQLGLYVIAPCVEADAFEQIDEPDGHGIDPPPLVASYLKEKRGAGRPVFLNLDGGRIPWTDSSLYTDYAAGADWIGFDYYPLNRGDGTGAIIRIANGLVPCHISNLGCCLRRILVDPGPCTKSILFG